MKIYTLNEILKTGHIGDEKYVRYEEIEQLGKEKEWQLNQIIEYKIRLFFDCYGPGNEGRLIALKETEEEMQQALKEGG